ncbi:MAG: helix-turn-helix transcriptional regulator [Eubacterium sp.]|nr:helix-turn-helix transcriptional regulator [Eubacterium sp.]
MNNKELTKIREEKKLSKGDFAKLLDITPMLLGKYDKGSIKIPDSIVEKLKVLADTATATEIEVKKTARKAARKAKEKIEATATSDTAAATEIEVKKAVREGSRKAKDTAEKAVEALKDTARKAIGIPNIIIQSPMGGHISLEEIAGKVPKDTADVYVRVDENKLYYVLEDGETGDVDIW